MELAYNQLLNELDEKIISAAHDGARNLALSILKEELNKYYNNFDKH